MRGMSKNIVVLGWSDFLGERLTTIRDAADCEFHGVIDASEIRQVEEYDIESLWREAVRGIEAIDGGPDAIVTHWDFPLSTLLPLLCAEFGLRGPSLKSVLRCEHKYWSRLVQRDAVPELTPAFFAVDPFVDDPLSGLEIPLPFWIKPVKAFGTQLGYRIESREDLDVALDAIRAGIGKFDAPFDWFLERGDLPPEVERVCGAWCVAEEILTGAELAPEGYARDGRVEVHGVLDMGSPPAFDRYEYPSVMPEEVREKAIAATKRVIAATEMTDACFNVEFFFDAERDRLRIVEINPRISSAHADLFLKVDGRSNHEVAVSVALGREPELPEGRGEFGAAAKLMLRREADAVVTRVPTDEEIAAVIDRWPGTFVKVDAVEGKRLSELPEQEPGSFCYAVVFAGGEDHDDLLRRRDGIARMLPFEFGEDG